MKTNESPHTSDEYSTDGRKFFWTFIPSGMKGMFPKGGSGSLPYQTLKRGGESGCCGYRASVKLPGKKCIGAENQTGKIGDYVNFESFTKEGLQFYKRTKKPILAIKINPDGYQAYPTHFRWISMILSGL